VENNKNIRIICYYDISISVCKMWEARVGIQVFRRKFHTYMHLD